MPRGSIRNFIGSFIPALRQRARLRLSALSALRSTTWPGLKSRAQTRIYGAIVKHQQNKRRRSISETQRHLRFPVITPAGRRTLVDEHTANMLNWEGGSKRARLAQGLSSLKKMGQDYQARRVGAEEYPDVPGSYPGVKISRHENEELIIFPSYARPHVKSSNKHMKDLHREEEQLSEEEYWRREWEVHEDKNAVVDVDLRGWIYTNLKGPMNRRNRLLLTIARQLSGVPAPQAGGGYSGGSIADPGSHSARHEQEIAEREVRHIEKRGERESQAAAQGRYSERPDALSDELLDSNSEPSAPPSPRSRATRIEDDLDALAKRESWREPSNFTPEELETANKHLLTRLRPFLTTPSENTPLTIFYYNEETSQSRTTTTNEYGHFNFRAALSFIPTHVRVLAGEKLSATEEVHITEPNGISLISDIDDTIKHSHITAGAREIFRNTFIRNLPDLTVDGVKQWYAKMTDMGVKLHYVSNSPWQLYPTLIEYFGIAGLPRGSFHLKQYTGMLQGIFEPVAERKKGTLDRIFNDFPERRFILVGDSGEADLELYTDVAMANPRRVLGIFIRDVTTPKKQGLGFFNSSRFSNATSSSDSGASNSGAFSSTPSRSAQHRPARPALPPRPMSMAPNPPEEEDLIDLTDDFEPTHPTRSATDPVPRQSPSRATTTSASRTSELALRPIQSNQAHNSIARKPAPPPPPKPRQLSGRQNSTTGSEASTYTGAVRNKLTSLYNALPGSPATSSPSSRAASPTRSTFGGGAQFGSGSLAFAGDGNETNDRPAPQLPPRRTGLASYPAAAASYVWNGGNTGGGQSRGYADSAFQGEAPMSKAEEMWKRRWLRSKEMLERKGVVLRAWRVGEDVMEEAVKLVREARREDERGGDGQRRNASEIR